MPVDHSPPPPLAEFTQGAARPNSGDIPSLPGSADPHIIQYENYVSAVAKPLRLPPFCRQNPRLWFAQIELAFHNCGIASDVSKFRHVATQLSGDVLDSVSDIILSPPLENKYDAIKARIVAAFDEGDEKRLRRLLHGNGIGADERPTAYLHRLRNLAAGQCSEPVLRSLFLEQLPDQIRAILVIADVQDLARLAEMADRALEIARPVVAAVSTSGGPSQSPAADRSPH